MDLLVVAEPGDVLARAVTRRARERGAEVAHLAPLAAAAALTLTVDGGRARVTPRVPVLLRSTAARADGGGTAFARREAQSHLWGACALMDRPVVNRPGAFGLAGLFADSLPVSELRARRLPCTERYTSEPPGGADGELCVQDLGTFDTAVLPDLPAGDGPFRSRAMPAAVQRAVVVVGERAWAGGDEELGARSVAVAARLELDLAVLTWSLGEDGRTAALARIDPFPRGHVVAACADELAAALCELLL